MYVNVANFKTVSCLCVFSVESFGIRVFQSSSSSLGMKKEPAERIVKTEE